MLFGQLTIPAKPLSLAESERLTSAGSHSKLEKTGGSMSYVRIGVVGSLLLSLAMPAGSQEAGSLESSYAAMCTTAAAREGETCVALQKALSEKATRPSTPSSQAQSLDRAVWGLYAELIGQTLAVGSPNDPVFAKVEFRLDNGRVLEKWTWYGAGAFGSSETYTVERIADTGQLRFTTSAGTKWVGSASANGAVEFSKNTIVGKSIQGYYPSSGGIERRTSYRGATTVERLSPYDASRESQYLAMASANKVEEQRSKAEAAERRFQMVGAIVNGASQSYANYQAEEAGRLANATSAVVTPGSVVGSSTVDSASSRAGIGYGNAGDSAGRTSTSALRFVLSIGMEPMAGDKVNPTCYSNVITRPGPPGWGSGGFLPSGSAQQAHSAVQALKAQFISRCRATGRQVTSDGNFHWVWNEQKSGDVQVANARPQHREDVLVQLD